MQVPEDAPCGGFDNGNAVIIQTRDADLTADSYGAPVVGFGRRSRKDRA